MTERPLSGIRVLDSTQMMAGPLGIQILADLGAEVIKIERPGKAADVNRRLHPTNHNTSAYFMALNRGKKGLELTYDQPGHKEIFLKLAEKCDVIVENFKPGSMKRLGLDYETLKKIKPDIVYSAVSGYGQDGPKSALPAVDIVVQATSGFMSVNGEKRSEGMKAGSSFADVYSSVSSAIAILAGIIYRQETGEGVLCDTSMQRSMMTTVGYEFAKYLNVGEITKPNGNAHHEVAFFQTVPANDGAVMVEAATEEHFSAFAKALGLPDLLKDENYKDAASRLVNIEKLEEVIFPITEKMSMTEITTLCVEAGVPAGDVNTQERILRSSHCDEQEMITVVRDKKMGDWKVLGLPIKFDKFIIPKECRSPQEGEHTVEVLKDLLGMAEEEIRELYNYEGSGVIV